MRHTRLQPDLLPSNDVIGELCLDPLRMCLDRCGLCCHLHVSLGPGQSLLRVPGASVGLCQDEETLPQVSL